MNARHAALLILLLCSFLLPVHAQESFREYYWERAEITLQIPASWDQPVFTSSDDRTLETLFLAQELASTPDTRPPALPFITIFYHRSTAHDQSVYQQLSAYLRDIQIEPVGELPDAFLNTSAITTRGTNADGSLIGIGRAAILPDASRLFIIGRSARVQYSAFEMLLNSLTESIVQSPNRVSLPPQPALVWQLQSDPLDGEWMLLDPAAIITTPDQKLLVADRSAGILQVDALTGLLLAQIPAAQPFVPLWLALSADQILHVADDACACIRRFSADTELEALTGFAAGTPRSIAFAADGTLYATDLIDNQPVVLAGSQSFAHPDWQDQPMLLTDRSGTVYAFTAAGSLYTLTEQGAALYLSLEPAPDNALMAAFDASNNLLVLAGDQHILHYDASGQLIAQFGQTDLTRAFAAGADGTLYTITGDDIVATVSALRPGIAAGRIGAAHLLPSVTVQGEFTDPLANAAHLWTFDASRGDSITLTVIASYDTPALDTALRLLAPDGSELAFADQDESGTRSNPADPQIIMPQLPQDGLYLVLVEQRFGAGRYTLGYTHSQPLTLDRSVTTRSGTLRSATPIQSYWLTGRAGQIVTITLYSRSGTLDPALRLYSSSGDLLAANDDALDPAYGTDARLQSIRLDRTGTFRLDAAIFAGEGRYLLEIIPES